MASSPTDTLKRYFDAIRAHDWSALADCVASDVERNGPYLDVVRGREAYAEFLAGVVPKLVNYELRIDAVHETREGDALALLSETCDLDGARTEFPEALHFKFDAQGLRLLICLLGKRHQFLYVL